MRGREVGRNRKTSASQKGEVELVDGWYIFPGTPHYCGRKQHALLRDEEVEKECFFPTETCREGPFLSLPITFHRGKPAGRHDIVSSSMSRWTILWFLTQVKSMIAKWESAGCYNATSLIPRLLFALLLRATHGSTV